MLYKFKSKVTGDLIMLEPDAKRLLKIMGRDDQVKGIFLADQLAAAIAAQSGMMWTANPSMWRSATAATVGGARARQWSVGQHLRKTR